MKRMFALTAAIAIFLAMGAASPAAAQSYPSKPIKFIVGYPPGGGTDIIARVVGQKLSERLGQPVTIENKPGASSILAAELVQKAPADGYTLLVGASGVMVFNPGLFDRLPYDPVKDFAPVTLLASDPLVFAVNPSVQAETLSDLLGIARGKPGQLFYSSGATAFHVATKVLTKQAGVDIAHVPYKGSAEAITAAVGGQVAVVAADLPAALAQVRAGKVRALAVSSAKRSAMLPNVPSVAEAGLPNYDLMLWIGLFAPKATPQAVIDKLYGELSVILKEESFREKLTSLGYETINVGLSPAELAIAHKAEVDKWTKASRELGIRAE